MDTIAAQATPPGKGGVGIIRISGPSSVQIAQKILGKIPRARFAEYLPFLGADGKPIDVGIALFFKGPHSFTGEDVLELQGHGGQMVVDLLLEAVLQQGARIARPGEFSERAFLNDKLDLAQAEAVADLIDATSTAAAKSALNSLTGSFSREINSLVEQLIEARMYVESAIDFPEEEIDFLADDQIQGRIDAILNHLERVLVSSSQGAILKEGLNVVILGQPNAGKSSLLNCLAERESAIVTDIAGTTRDVLREHIHIDGLPLHILDTAGLRTDADVVEKEGIRRAWQATEKADAALLMVDDAHGWSDEDEEILDQIPTHLNVLIVLNKIDKSGRQAGTVMVNHKEAVALSVASGAGITDLKVWLKRCVGYSGTPEGLFLARRRHIDALLRAKAAVEHGRDQLVNSRAGELLAEDLRQAQLALNEITGDFDNEDLLGKIFSSFCIGK